MNVHQEVEYLREENRQLKNAMIGRRVGFPFAWRLNAGEEKLLNCLYTSPTGRSTRNTLMIASSKSAYVDRKIVDVRVSHLRKKVMPFGIRIRTIWGEGYELTPESVAIIKAALA